jgi:iron complex outermembrane receptor protein
MSFKSFALTPISAAFLSFVVASSAMAVDEKVETVYVSATRSETVQVPVATQINVIDAEEIRLSGASTLTEVLRMQGGIQIQDADGSGGRNVSVSMRGFTANATNNILILVDGRKLNNPSLSGPALNTVALKDIERVEIIEGSAGVLYGDQAVGGVINVVMRKAKEGEFNGSVSAQRGSYDLEGYTANINQAFTNGLNYNISAQKRLANNYRDNNESEVTNVLGNIGFNFDAGRVFVEQQRINDDLRIPGALFLAEAANNPRQTLKPNDFSNQDTDITRAGGEFSFLENWKLLGEYSDRDESGYAFFDDYDKTDGFFPFVSAYDMRIKNITPRIVGSIATGSGNTIVTIGYDQVEADYKTKDGYTNFSQEQDAVYAQVIYPITNAFAVTLGARHANVDDTNHGLKNSHKDSVNAGELGLSYQLTPEWRAYARVADGFRFANADENGFKLPAVDFLEVQTSRSQEAGVAWSGEAANVKYSLFNMTIDNEIMYDPMSGVFGANINLPKSERQGFLFDGDVQLSEQIGLRANYTYTDAKLTSGNFDNKTVPFVSKNLANIGVMFTFVKNVTVSIDANYTGSRYLVGDDANVLAKTDPVTLFNLNLIWDVKSAEFGFRVKNITGETYADYQGANWAGVYLYPQSKSSYEAHVTYSF